MSTTPSIKYWGTTRVESAYETYVPRVTATATNTDGSSTSAAAGLLAEFHSKLTACWSDGSLYFPGINKAMDREEAAASAEGRAASRAPPMTQDELDEDAQVLRGKLTEWATSYFSGTQVQFELKE